MYDSLWGKVLPHLNVERMRADVAECFELSRWSSHDKIVELAQLIADKMEQAGLSDVRLIEAPADGKTAYGGWVMPQACDVMAARLCEVAGDVRGTVLADYETNPTSLMLQSRATPPGGVNAEVVVADDASACSTRRVAGRLVLTACFGVAFSLAAMRAGAVGIISDCTCGRRFFKEGDYLDRTNEWHNYTIPPWDDAAKGFGFSISPESGRHLRARLNTGATVRLHADVQTRHYSGVLPVVSGLLPGSNPETIAITGHYDECGADDNCSQIAVALEAVRAIRAMVEAGQIPPLQRGIRLLFPMEVRGFNALVQDHEETQHIRVGLNIDTVGTDQNAATSTCTLTDSFPSAPSFVEEFLAELLGRLAEKNPLFRWQRAAAEVIDNVFGEPLIGAPTPCLYHYSATHHLPLDTPDRLSGRMLLDMARVTATYATFLANAGLPEALWFAELVADQTASRIHAAAARALRHAADAGPLRTLLRQVDALAATYTARLTSARWLVPDCELLPTPDTLACEDYPASGDLRLLPRELYDERVRALQARIEEGRAAAAAQIGARAAAFSQVRLTAETPSLPVSYLVPVKAFRGFLAFEDLSHEEREFVSRELEIEIGWGAPVWLQNALMFANGKRTVTEIGVLLLQHCNRALDVPHLEKVFVFLQQRHLVRFRPYLTSAMVRSALVAAEIEAGNTVLVHFSLSRFGYIEGGADGLIDTLLDLLGPDGTLMMPAFTFSWLGRATYDPARTPSGVGAVADRFWRRDGVQRSLHPTHAFAATGKLASLLLVGHDYRQPPLGADSPIARLAEAGGKVLMFAPRKANTSMHVGEYLAGLPFVDLVCPIVEAGARREVVVPRCPWHVNFEVAYAQLEAAGLVREEPLGESTLYTMRCRDAIEAQAAVARATPEALIQPGCNCAYCAGLKRYCRERGRLDPPRDP